jgi:hypothetical protein
VTYFPDGTPYSYLGDEPGTVNVGWLDADHPFPTATPSEPFLTALARACRHGINRTRGRHRCELCPRSTNPGLSEPTTVKLGETELLVGSAELRVVGPNGVVFPTPDMVIHYVAEHSYRPPDAFEAAILQAKALPG